MLSTLEVRISPTLYRGDIYFTIYSVKTLAATRKWGCHMYCRQCVLAALQTRDMFQQRIVFARFLPNAREGRFFVLQPAVEIQARLWRLYVRGCKVDCDPSGP